ncbi:Schwann cell myelin protein-like [Rhinoderma darwinii]|uniref:Schwann cell myelin protein-like n=1 Tax=Rhinoderma darwinii TaxID=43563 RepID=UPI003F67408E
MDAMKQVYLFIICQGFYLGSVCQDWTFPSTITALIGSCVEIPCTYNNPSRISGTSSTVWYLYASRGYTQILNTKDSSSVIGKYKDRTSLVPGEKSCTLRIDPVRREDEDTYYPGIAEKRDRNAYSKYSEIVHLDVTDKVKIMLYWTKFMTEGVATVIQCTVEHTCRSRPPSLQWNKPGQFKKKSVEIVGEYWREESELTYIPSYVDDGTPVQCTATYPNGPRTERSEILNINYAPKNVSIAVIGMNDVIEGSDVTLQCSSYSKPGTYKYEWYKGKNNTKLLDAGRKITVQNVNRDTDPYSCVVVNRLGRGKSATKKIPELYHRKSEDPKGLPLVQQSSTILVIFDLGSHARLRWKKYRLVIIDVFTKWVEVFPTASPDAITVAKALVNEIIPRFGIPEKIYSDNGILKNRLKKTMEETGKN